VVVELTVLGCSGSYAGPDGAGCSGYLVREGGTAIWVDCGNGTFGALQARLPVRDVSAVVLTHEHPDHCVDLYGLHVMLRYALHRGNLPVYAPAGLGEHLGTLVGGDWGDAFQWHVIDERAPVTIGAATLRFSRTDHPPPTYAVEVAAGGSRLVYTSDTGPGWSVAAFGHDADLVLSEATYLDGQKPVPIHLSAKEAGTAARAAGARRLMLTHVWPEIDRRLTLAEGSAAFGEPALLAAPGLVTTVG
jgi:ribonuclease BN (tRNA processing enzyme)